MRVRRTGFPQPCYLLISPEDASSNPVCLRLAPDDHHERGQSGTQRCEAAKGPNCIKRDAYVSETLENYHVFLIESRTSGVVAETPQPRRHPGAAPRTFT